jgi:hypothetical protein
MGDRRQFLRSIAEAGAAFAGCSLGRGSLRAQSAARPREVVVGGRRVRTIDIHAHVVIPEATAIMGLRHLVAESDAAQIIIGTDYPYPWSTTTVDHVLKTPELTDADRPAILGETAAKLLRIA